MTAAAKKTGAKKKTKRAGARRAPKSKSASSTSARKDARPARTRRPTLQKRMERLSLDMVDRGIRLEEALDQLEKCFLQHVLAAESGNQTRAAARLELHRNTLRRKMERHGLK